MKMKPLTIKQKMNKGLRSIMSLMLVTMMLTTTAAQAMPVYANEDVPVVATEGQGGLEASQPEAQPDAPQPEVQPEVQPDAPQPEAQPETPQPEAQPTAPQSEEGDVVKPAMGIAPMGAPLDNPRTRDGGSTMAFEIDLSGNDKNTKEGDVAEEVLTGVKMPSFIVVTMNGQGSSIIVIPFSSPDDVIYSDIKGNASATVRNPAGEMFTYINESGQSVTEKCWVIDCVNNDPTTLFILDFAVAFKAGVTPAGVEMPLKAYIYEAEGGNIKAGGAKAATNTYTATAKTNEAWVLNKTTIFNGTTGFEERNYAQVENNDPAYDYVTVPYSLDLVTTGSGNAGRIYQDKVTITDTITGKFLKTGIKSIVVKKGATTVFTENIANITNDNTHTFSFTETCDPDVAPENLHYVVEVTFDKDVYTNRYQETPILNELVNVSNTVTAKIEPAAVAIPDMNLSVATPAEFSFGYKQGEPAAINLALHTRVSIGGTTSAAYDWEMRERYGNSTAPLTYTLTNTGTGDVETREYKANEGTNNPTVVFDGLKAGTYKLNETQGIATGFPTMTEKTIEILPPNTHGISIVKINGVEATAGGDGYYSISENKAANNITDLQAQVWKQNSYADSFSLLGAGQTVYLYKDNGNGTYGPEDGLPVKTSATINSGKVSFYGIEYGPTYFIVGGDMAEYAQREIKPVEGLSLTSTVGASGNANAIYYISDKGGLRLGINFTDLTGTPSITNFKATFELTDSNGDPVYTGADRITVTQAGQVLVEGVLTAPGVQKNIPQGNYKLQIVELEINGQDATARFPLPTNKFDVSIVAGKYDIIANNVAGLMSGGMLSLKSTEGQLQIVNLDYNGNVVNPPANTTYTITKDGQPFGGTITAAQFAAGRYKQYVLPGTYVVTQTLPTVTTGGYINVAKKESVVVVTDTFAQEIISTGVVTGVNTVQKGITTTEAELVQTVAFLNAPLPDVTAKKISASTNAPLAGIEFEIYKSTDCNTRVNVAVVRSAATSGNITFTDLQRGKYYIVERATVAQMALYVQEPEMTTLLDALVAGTATEAQFIAAKGKGVQEVNIDWSDLYTNGQAAKDVGTIKNVPFVSLKVSTVSTERLQTVIPATYQITKNGVPLSTTVVGSDFVDAEGKALKLGIGTYVVTQTSATGSYIENTAKYTFKVNSDGAIYDEAWTTKDDEKFVNQTTSINNTTGVITTRFANVPFKKIGLTKSGQLNITDDVGNRPTEPLSGAGFVVYYEKNSKVYFLKNDGSGTFDEFNISDKDAKAKEADYLFTTDVTGKIDFGLVDPSNEPFKLREVIVPDVIGEDFPYITPADVTASFSPTKNAQNEIVGYVDAALTLTNIIDPYYINISKVQLRKTGATTYEEIVGAQAPGGVFEIWKCDENGIIAAETTRPIDTITTGTGSLSISGTAISRQLPAGFYLIREVKAPGFSEKNGHIYYQPTLGVDVWAASPEGGNEYKVEVKTLTNPANADRYQEFKLGNLSDGTDVPDITGASRWIQIYGEKLGYRYLNGVYSSNPLNGVRFELWPAYVKDGEYIPYGKAINTATSGSVKNSVGVIQNGHFMFPLFNSTWEIVNITFESMYADAAAFNADYPGKDWDTLKGTKLIDYYKALEPTASFSTTEEIHYIIKEIATPSGYETVDKIVQETIDLSTSVAAGYPSNHGIFYVSDATRTAINADAGINSRYHKLEQKEPIVNYGGDGYLEISKYSKEAKTVVLATNTPQAEFEVYRAKPEDMTQYEDTPIDTIALVSGTKRLTLPPGKYFLKEIGTPENFYAKGSYQQDSKAEVTFAEGVIFGPVEISGPAVTARVKVFNTPYAKLAIQTAWSGATVNADGLEYNLVGSGAAAGKNFTGTITGNAYTFDSNLPDGTYTITEQALPATIADAYNANTMAKTNKIVITVANGLVTTVTVDGTAAEKATITSTGLNTINATIKIDHTPKALLHINKGYLNAAGDELKQLPPNLESATFTIKKLSDSTTQTLKWEGTQGVSINLEVGLYEVTETAVELEDDTIVYQVYSADSTPVYVEATETGKIYLTNGKDAAGKTQLDPLTVVNTAATDYFYNSSNVGEFRITKEDGTDATKKLTGATFRIWKDEAKTQPLVVAMAPGTGAEAGTYTFTAPAGTYWIEETVAPNGYQLVSKLHKITVVGKKSYGGGTNEIIIKNPKFMTLTALVETNYTAIPSPEGLEDAVLVDGGDGAVKFLPMRLLKLNESTGDWEDLYDLADGGSNPPPRTTIDGVVSFPNLGVGQYKVLMNDYESRYAFLVEHPFFEKEATAPIITIKVEDDVLVATAAPNTGAGAAWNANDWEKKNDNQIYISSDFQGCRIAVKKIDYDDYHKDSDNDGEFDREAKPLTGAAFRLFIYNKVTDAYELWGGTETTNAQGIVVFDAMLFEEATKIRITEISAPDGYEIIHNYQPQSQDLTLTESELLKSQSVLFFNKKAETFAGMELKKTSTTAAVTTPLSEAALNVNYTLKLSGPAGVEIGNYAPIKNLEVNDSNFEFKGGAVAIAKADVPYSINKVTIGNSTSKQQPGVAASTVYANVNDEGWQELGAAGATWNLPAGTKTFKVQYNDTLPGAGETDFSVGLDFKPGDITVDVTYDKNLGNKAIPRPEIDYIKNTAVVTGSVGTTPINFNNSHEITLAVKDRPKMEIEKTITNFTATNIDGQPTLDVRPGGWIEYEVILSNTSDSALDIENPAIIDIMAKGGNALTFDDATPVDITVPARWTNKYINEQPTISGQNSILSWVFDGETLAKDEEIKIVYRAKVASVAEGILVNAAYGTSYKELSYSQTHPSGAGFVAATPAKAIREVQGAEFTELVGILGKDCGMYIKDTDDIAVGISGLFLLQKNVSTDDGTTWAIDAAFPQAVYQDGTIKYRLDVQNGMEADIKEVAFVDVLPSATDGRGTTWTADLLAALTLDPSSVKVYNVLNDVATPMAVSKYDVVFSDETDYNFATNAKTASLAKAHAAASTATDPSKAKSLVVALKDPVAQGIVRVEFEMNVADALSTTITEANARKLLMNSFTSLGEPRDGFYVNVQGDRVAAQFLADPVKISGQAWEDTNADGLYDSTKEDLLPGVKVELYKKVGTATATLIDTVEASVDGTYVFEDVASTLGATNETYFVRFLEISNTDYYFANIVTDSAKATINSDVVTPGNTYDSGAKISGETAGFTANYDVENIDAGLIPYAKISGYVWLDADKDGIKDASENGQAGVMVSLSGAKVVAAVPVAADGYYEFTGLKAGSYTVEFDKTAVTSSTVTYVWTAKQADATQPSIVDSEATFTNEADAKATAAVTIAYTDAGGDVSNIHAGLKTANNFISGEVWEDINVNAKKDEINKLSLESKVTLMRREVADPTGTEQVHDVVLQTSNGEYKFDTNIDFSGLYEYRVVFETPAALIGKYEYSRKDLTVAANINSDVNSVEEQAITKNHLQGLTDWFKPTASAADIDAGLYAITSISGKLWKDVNGDGIQDAGDTGYGYGTDNDGHTVILIKASDNSVVASTKTDASGNYTFSKVIAGEYKVTFSKVNIQLSDTAKNHWTLAVQGGDQTKDSDAKFTDSTANTATTDAITVAYATAVPSIDAGVTQVPNFISGIVWEDTDKDGIQDAGENALNGVTVELYRDDDTNPKATTTTAAGGAYKFININTSGTYEYKVVFVNSDEEKYVYSPANQGSDDTKDSDAANTVVSTTNTDPGYYESANTGFMAIPANQENVDCGVYVLPSYTVTFHPENGGATSDLSVKEGRLVTKPTNPVKTGYTFDNWYGDSATLVGATTQWAFATAMMPAKNIDLWAKYTANNFTVTYKLDGGVAGSGAEAPTNGQVDTVACDATYAVKGIGATISPTKSGYDFDGWKVTANTAVAGVPTVGSTVYSAAGASFTMPAGDVELTATWTNAAFKVFYDLDLDGLDGGSDPADVVNASYSLDYEDNHVIPGLTNNPLKEGHTFVEWEVTQNDGTTVTVPTVGTTFDTAADNFDMPDGDVYLQAQWDINDYDVYYDLNGGTSHTSETIDAKYEDITFATTHNVKGLTTRPTKEGYTFVGWKVITNGAALGKAPAVGTIFNTANGNFAMPAGDVYLEAQWEIDTYDVYYDLQGGTSHASETIATKYADVTFATDHDVKGLTHRPSKEGYTFAGWKVVTNEAGATKLPLVDTVFNTAADKFAMPAGDVYLVAQWNINDYDVYYDLNGGNSHISETIDAKYEDITFATTYNILGLTHRPSKEGYTFAGWKVVTNTAPAGRTPTVGTVFNTAADSFTMPAGDVYLEAQWNINKYDVYYDLNEGESHEDETIAPVYEDLTFATDHNVRGLNYRPNREGYTFVGWKVVTNEAPAGRVPLVDTVFNTVADKFAMPAGDVYLEAQWDINTYDVYYDLNGGTSHPDEIILSAYLNITFGTPHNIVGLTNRPSKEGYTFAGWKVVTNEAPAGRVPTVGTVFDMLAITFAMARGPVAGQVIMPAGDLYLEAQWNINTYGVTYELDGGISHKDDVIATTPYATIFAEDHDVLGLTDKPSKEGYTFEGWEVTVNEAPTGRVPVKGTVFAVAGDKFAMPAGNVTLTAIWQPIDYTITYDLDGGIADPSDMVVGPYIETFGTTHTVVGLKEAPTKDTFRFKGWKVTVNEAPAGREPEVGTIFSRDGQMFTVPAGNVTLTAIWAPLYNVTYDFNGGLSIHADFADQHIAIHEEGETHDVKGLVEEHMPSKFGHTFIGWVASAEGHDVHGTEHTEHGTNFAMPASHVTLTAQWAENEHTVIYDFNDGSGKQEKKTEKYGNEYAVEYIGKAIPTRVGYTFEGWIVTAVGDGAVDVKVDDVFMAAGGKFTMPNGDVTLQAKWSKNLDEEITKPTVKPAAEPTAKPATAPIARSVTRSVAQAAKTGDDMMVNPYIAMAMVSLLLLGVVVRKKTKRKEETK